MKNTSRARKLKKEEKVDISQAQTLVDELFSLMGVSVEARVSWDKEAEVVKIEIEAKEEAGLLIGRHGETINSLQFLLAIALQTRTGVWRRVVVDVGDWRKRQEERLKELARQTAERVVNTGESQALYNLSPSERRIIHLELSENSKVATESQGEGEERFLLVKPKSG